MHIPSISTAQIPGRAALANDALKEELETGPRLRNSTPPGAQALVKEVDVYDMSDEDPRVGDCARCGRPIFERQSHLMIVPSGRPKVFYHAGCEPLRTAEELARNELEADRVNWRKDAWKANRAATRRTLAEPHDEPV